MFVWETEESSGKETVVNFGRRGWAGPDLLNSSEPFLTLGFEGALSGGVLDIDAS